jgi:hypothetical protein
LGLGITDFSGIFSFFLPAFLDSFRFFLISRGIVFRDCPCCGSN